MKTNVSTLFTSKKDNTVNIHNATGFSSSGFCKRYLGSLFRIDKPFPSTHNDSPKSYDSGSYYILTLLWIIKSAFFVNIELTNIVTEHVQLWTLIVSIYEFDKEKMLFVSVYLDKDGPDSFQSWKVKWIMTLLNFFNATLNCHEFQYTTLHSLENTSRFEMISGPL